MLLVTCYGSDKQLSFPVGKAQSPERLIPLVGCIGLYFLHLIEESRPYSLGRIAELSSIDPQGIMLSDFNRQVSFSMATLTDHDESVVWLYGHDHLNK